MTTALRSNPRPTCAVVLAAGEGSRLSALTRNAAGISVPKQYCSLTGSATLLDATLQRARNALPRARVAVVVAKQHRHWWQSTLSQETNTCRIEQPANRGTANGILLATLTIGAQDPFARAVFFPADHYVHHEARLESALHIAATARLASDELMLLGIEPSAPDPELGYVMPHSLTDSDGRSRVHRFVEKPSVRVAAELVADGALWNSFIFAAEVSTITALVRARYPKVVDDFETALTRGPDAIEALYNRLPILDFSRAILQGAQSQLSVLRVPECGWSDLGTPHRVAACLRQYSGRASPIITRVRATNLVNMAAALALNASATS